MAKKQPKEAYSPTLDRIGQTQKRDLRVVSWESVPAELIARLVVVVNDSGGSVLFGATRDRGAWALTFFHEMLPNKRVTDYCNGEEMLESWLEGQIEIWTDVEAELRLSKGSE